MGPTQPVTRRSWLVPASTSDSQVHCSLQSAVSVQSTKQSQPMLSSAGSSAQEDPDGQSLLFPHELVQSDPGKLGPLWQRPRSHDPLSMQGPPTRVLSLPAVPGGRSSPHPDAKRTAVSRIGRRDLSLIAGGTIDQAVPRNQRRAVALCNIRVTFSPLPRRARRAIRSNTVRHRLDLEPSACAHPASARTAPLRAARLAIAGPCRTETRARQSGCRR